VIEPPLGRAVAVAHSNIALAKYWGKAEVAGNYPAVPSLSLTLDALVTITRVEFDPALGTDSAALDGETVGGRPLSRISALLDQVRELAGIRFFARVESQNDFPTAAGLASSASGFAALALAATRAAGLKLPTEKISGLARAASASAARSLYGGWAALRTGTPGAERVAPPDHFPVAMLVAVTAAGPKAIGSTEGMKHTSATSPYYAPWVAHAPVLFERARQAVLARDLGALGPAVEQSALMMHASMLAADPAVIYFLPTTLAVMARVRELRTQGAQAYFTMDAGPHVKVLTHAASAADVAAALAEVPGVQRVITCRPGPDAYCLEQDLDFARALEHVRAGARR
jgi:diphosphomevalonate decarboxylase